MHPRRRDKNWTALSSGPWKIRKGAAAPFRTAIDSASQRFVTVRQVFPDGPAPKSRLSRHFGGGPFPVRRLPGLAGAVLMDTAPLSKRFNFEVSYHGSKALSTVIPESGRKFVQFVREKQRKFRCLWIWYDTANKAWRAQEDLAVQTLELSILDWIQAHLRCEFLDAVLPAISWTCNHGEIWILLAACCC